MTRIHHATAAKAKKFQITLSLEDNEVVATSKTGVRLASGLQGNKVLEEAITKATGKPAKGTPEAKTTARIKLTPESIADRQAALQAKNDAIRAAKKPAKVAVIVDPFEEAAKDAGWKKTRWGFRNEDPDSTSEIDCRRVNAWQELCTEQEIEVEQDEPEDDDSDADQPKSIVKAKYKTRYKPTKDKCGDSLSFEINEFVTVEDDETGEKKVSKKLLRAFAEANGCWVPSYGSLVSRTGGWNAGMARMNVANRLRAKIRQAAKAETKFEVVWPKV